MGPDLTNSHEDQPSALSELTGAVLVKSSLKETPPSPRDALCVYLLRILLHVPILGRFMELLVPTHH